MPGLYGRPEGHGHPVFVRLVSIDYYMAPPVPGLDVCFSFFEGTAVREVPVVRVYGSTPAGQKACLHIHKAFPYFYVPYDDDLPQEPQQAATWLRRMARSLEATMQLSQAQLAAGAQPEMNEAPQGNGDGNGNSRAQRQVVHNLQLVRARPFYGYHPSEQLYIKVVLYNPHDIPRAAQLLGNGAVMGKRMQPHESHIPFLLQIKMDFNLLGMGHVKLSQVLFREPLPAHAPVMRPGWDPPTAHNKVVAYERWDPDRSGPSQCTPHAVPVPYHGQPAPRSPLTPGLTAAQSQQQARLVWTVRSTPARYKWSDRQDVPASKRPERQTLCELELDACVEHITNRQEAVRVRLEDAKDDQHLLASLLPMWEEERERCGGQLPPRPPSPPRAPRPLCAAVEAVRADLMAVSAHIAAHLAQAKAQAAAQAGSKGPDITSPTNAACATDTDQPAHPAEPRPAGNQSNAVVPGPEQQQEGTQAAAVTAQDGAGQQSARHAEGKAMEHDGAPAWPWSSGTPAARVAPQQGQEANLPPQANLEHTPYQSQRVGVGLPLDGSNEDVQGADGDVRQLFSCTQPANRMTGTAADEVAVKATRALAAAVVGSLASPWSQPYSQSLGAPASQRWPGMLSEETLTRQAGLAHADQEQQQLQGSQDRQGPVPDVDGTPGQVGLSQEQGMAVLSQLPAASLPYGLTQLAEAAAATPAQWPLSQEPGSWGAADSQTLLSQYDVPSQLGLPSQRQPGLPLPAWPAGSQAAGPSQEQLMASSPTWAAGSERATPGQQQPAASPMAWPAASQPQPAAASSHPPHPPAPVEPFQFSLSQPNAHASPSQAGIPAWDAYAMTPAPIAAHSPELTVVPDTVQARRGPFSVARTGAFELSSQQEAAATRIDELAMPPAQPSLTGQGNNVNDVSDSLVGRGGGLQPPHQLGLSLPQMELVQPGSLGQGELNQRPVTSQSQPAATRATASQHGPPSQRQLAASPPTWATSQQHIPAHPSQPPPSQPHMPGGSTPWAGLPGADFPSSNPQLQAGLQAQESLARATAALGSPWFIPATQFDNASQLDPNRLPTDSQQNPHSTVNKNVQSTGGRVNTGQRYGSTGTGGRRRGSGVLPFTPAVLLDRLMQVDSVARQQLPGGYRAWQQLNKQSPPAAVGDDVVPVASDEARHQSQVEQERIESTPAASDVTPHSSDVTPALSEEEEDVLPLSPNHPSAHESDNDGAGGRLPSEGPWDMESMSYSDLQKQHEASQPGSDTDMSDTGGRGRNASDAGQGPFYQRPARRAAHASRHIEMRQDDPQPGHRQRHSARLPTGAAVRAGRPSLSQGAAGKLLESAAGMMMPLSGRGWQLYDVEGDAVEDVEGHTGQGANDGDVQPGAASGLDEGFDGDSHGDPMKDVATTSPELAHSSPNSSGQQPGTRGGSPRPSLPHSHRPASAPGISPSTGQGGAHRVAGVMEIMDNILGSSDEEGHQGGASGDVLPEQQQGGEQGAGAMWDWGEDPASPQERQEGEDWDANRPGDFSASPEVQQEQSELGEGEGRVEHRPAAWQQRQQEEDVVWNGRQSVSPRREQRGMGEAHVDQGHAGSGVDRSKEGQESSDGWDSDEPVVGQQRRASITPQSQRHYTRTAPTGDMEDLGTAPWQLFQSTAGRHPHSSTAPTAQRRDRQAPTATPTSLAMSQRRGVASRVQPLMLVPSLGLSPQATPPFAAPSLAAIPYGSIIAPTPALTSPLDFNVEASLHAASPAYGQPVGSPLSAPFRHQYTDAPRTHADQSLPAGSSPGQPYKHKNPVWPSSAQPGVNAPAPAVPAPLQAYRPPAVPLVSAWQEYMQQHPDVQSPQVWQLAAEQEQHHQPQQQQQQHQQQQEPHQNQYQHSHHQQHQQPQHYQQQHDHHHHDQQHGNHDQQQHQQHQRHQRQQQGDGSTPAAHATIPQTDGPADDDECDFQERGGLPARGTAAGIQSSVAGRTPGLAQTAQGVVGRQPMQLRDSSGVSLLRRAWLPGRQQGEGVHGVPGSAAATTAAPTAATAAAVTPAVTSAVGQPHGGVSRSVAAQAPPLPARQSRAAMPSLPPSSAAGGAAVVAAQRPVAAARLLLENPALGLSNRVAQSPAADTTTQAVPGALTVLGLIPPHLAVMHPSIKRAYKCPVPNKVATAGSGNGPASGPGHAPSMVAAADADPTSSRTLVAGAIAGPAAAPAALTTPGSVAHAEQQLQPIAARPALLSNGAQASHIQLSAIHQPVVNNLSEQHMPVSATGPAQRSGNGTKKRPRAQSDAAEATAAPAVSPRPSAQPADAAQGLQPDPGPGPVGLAHASSGGGCGHITALLAAQGEPESDGVACQPRILSTIRSHPPIAAPACLSTIPQPDPHLQLAFSPASLGDKEERSQAAKKRRTRNAQREAQVVHDGASQASSRPKARKAVAGGVERRGPPASRRAQLLLQLAHQPAETAARGRSPLAVAGGPGIKGRGMRQRRNRHATTPPTLHANEATLASSPAQPEMTPPLLSSPTLRNRGAQSTRAQALPNAVKAHHPVSAGAALASPGHQCVPGAVGTGMESPARADERIVDTGLEHAQGPGPDAGRDHVVAGEEEAGAVTAQSMLHDILFGSAGDDAASSDPPSSGGNAEVAEAMEMHMVVAMEMDLGAGSDGPIPGSGRLIATAWDADGGDPSGHGLAADGEGIAVTLSTEHLQGQRQGYGEMHGGDGRTATTTTAEDEDDGGNADACSADPSGRTVAGSSADDPSINADRPATSAARADRAGEGVALILNAESPQRQGDVVADCGTSDFGDVRAMEAVVPAQPHRGSACVSPAVPLAPGLPARALPMPPTGIPAISHGSPEVVAGVPHGPTVVTEAAGSPIWLCTPPSQQVALPAVMPCIQAAVMPVPLPCIPEEATAAAVPHAQAATLPTGSPPAQAVSKPATTTFAQAVALPAGFPLSQATAVQIALSVVQAPAPLHSTPPVTQTATVQAAPIHAQAAAPPAAQASTLWAAPATALAPAAQASKQRLALGTASTVVPTPAAPPSSSAPGCITAALSSIAPGHIDHAMVNLTTNSHVDNPLSHASASSPSGQPRCLPPEPAAPAAPSAPAAAVQPEPTEPAAPHSAAQGTSTAPTVGMPGVLASITVAGSVASPAMVSATPAAAAAGAASSAVPATLALANTTPTILAAQQPVAAPDPACSIQAATIATPEPASASVVSNPHLVSSPCPNHPHNLAAPPPFHPPFVPDVNLPPYSNVSLSATPVAPSSARCTPSLPSTQPLASAGPGCGSTPSLPSTQPLPATQPLHLPSPVLGVGWSSGAALGGAGSAGCVSPIRQLNLSLADAEEPRCPSSVAVSRDFVGNFVQYPNANPEQELGQQLPGGWQAGARHAMTLHHATGPAAGPRGADAMQGNLAMVLSHVERPCRPCEHLVQGSSQPIPIQAGPSLMQASSQHGPILMRASSQPDPNLAHLRSQPTAAACMPAAHASYPHSSSNAAAMASLPATQPLLPPPNSQQALALIPSHSSSQQALQVEHVAAAAAAAIRQPETVVVQKPIPGTSNTLGPILDADMLDAQDVMQSSPWGQLQLQQPRQQQDGQPWSSQPNSGLSGQARNCPADGHDSGHDLPDVDVSGEAEDPPGSCQNGPDPSSDGWQHPEGHPGAAPAGAGPSGTSEGLHPGGQDYDSPAVHAPGGDGDPPGRSTSGPPPSNDKQRPGFPGAPLPGHDPSGTPQGTPDGLHPGGQGPQDSPQGPDRTNLASTCWFRPRVSPPSRQELASSWAAAGLLAVVHQEPFYGHAEDVPARPVVFAGREWRIPCIDDIPTFQAAHMATHHAADQTGPSPAAPAPGSEAAGNVQGLEHNTNNITANASRQTVLPQAGRSCLEQLLAAAQRASPGVASHLQLPQHLQATGSARRASHSFRPLLPPPSRALVAAWAAAQQLPSPSRPQPRQAALAAASAGHVSFDMHPNTGALVPKIVTIPRTPAGAGTLLPDGTQASCGAASLLGTPEMLASAPGPVSLAPPPPAPVVEEVGMLDAPPSPKYDERTTFFFTGAFGMRAPVLPASTGDNELQGLEDGGFDLGGVDIAAPPQSPGGHPLFTQAPTLPLTYPATLPATLPATQPDPTSMPNDSHRTIQAAGANGPAVPGNAAGSGSTREGQAALLQAWGGAPLQATPRTFTPPVRAQPHTSTTTAADMQPPTDPTAQRPTVDPMTISGGADPPETHAAGQPKSVGGVQPRTQVMGTAHRPPLSLFSPLPRGGSGAPPVTPSSQRGFKRAVPGRGEQLTCVALEVLADCRGALLPDPRHDMLRCVTLVAWDDGADLAGGAGTTTRMLICSAPATHAQANPASNAAPNNTATANPYQAAAATHASRANPNVNLAANANLSADPAAAGPCGADGSGGAIHPGSEATLGSSPKFQPLVNDAGPSGARLINQAGAGTVVPAEPAGGTGAAPGLVDPAPAAASIIAPHPQQQHDDDDQQQQKQQQQPPHQQQYDQQQYNQQQPPQQQQQQQQQQLHQHPQQQQSSGGGAAATTSPVSTVFPSASQGSGAWAAMLQEYASPAGDPTHIDGLPDDWQIETFKDEASLIAGVIWALLSLDPDVIIGWDLQKGSLGWLAERAAHLGTNLLRAVSRTPGLVGLREKQDDEYGRLHASGLHSSGRVLLNMWRIIRGEVKLNMYSFESCCAAVLRRRVPCIPHTQMAAWFKAGPAGGRWRALRAIRLRCVLTLLMIDTLDLVGRTAEMARAFGIDMFSVLTRGSQYRVESLMVRLAHTQNYLMMSPSREQVGGQPAMESIPLVMEPESRLYCNPVIVLDFQSLYPSQMIAYNLCYSTCVGRVAHARAAAATAAQQAAPAPAPGGPLDVPLAVSTGVRLGVTSYAPRADHIVPGGPADPNKLIIAPNGVAYLPPAARPGVLPRMLKEILDTRILAKTGMKKHAADRVLQRVLNARQFGLKMISNVTYGYTSAGFSGRMPFAELADSIVQSGRQTLENAIALVEGNASWDARVVYGDTDSMFVLLKGRSREDAFRIGAEIAAAVTAANPAPVTLKMEKVYHPCVLQTKKRYVGFAYESPTQTVPTFDAKGIETVRRDGCPAVSKLLEASLRLLFSTKDLSQVRSYLVRQWSKVLACRVSIQDFVFAKEVRLGTYSAAAATIPPAAVVAARAMKADPRAEPRYAERVPYVVVAGPPGARLVDTVVDPHQLVESGGRLRLNGLYYITKQIIPALERVLSLVGADVRAWFADMPRATRMLPQKRPAAALGLAHPSGPASHHAPFPPLGPPSLPPLWSAGPPGSGAPLLSSRTIDQFYLSRHCGVCDTLTRVNTPLCDACAEQPQMALAVLQARVSRLERQHLHMVRICLHCGGGGACGTPAPASALQRPRRPPTGAAARPTDSNGTGPIAAGGNASLVGSAGRLHGSGPGAASMGGGEGGHVAPLGITCHVDGGVVCDSLDCGVFYERRKLWHELASLGALLHASEQWLDTHW